MGIVNGLNRILNSRYTGVAMFGITGAYKAASDYRQAPPEEKSAVLSRDLTILGGSALGILGYNRASKAYFGSNFHVVAKNLLKTGFENFKKSKLYGYIDKNMNHITRMTTKEVFSTGYSILKDCAMNVAMVGSGILGAIGANYLIQAVHFHKKRKEVQAKDEYIAQFKENNQPEPKEMARFEEFKNKITHNQITNDLNNLVDAETKRNIVSNITNMPEMRIFTNSMIGMQSFDVMQEKSFKNKMKKTTNNLITGTFVPIFYLSLASNITRNMKNNILRAPFVFASMVAGTMLTNKHIENRLAKLGD